MTTKDEKLTAALAVNDDRDPYAGWREIDKDQFQPEAFRMLLSAIRAAPDNIIPLVVEHQALPFEEAFAKCQPEYLSSQEFIAAKEKQQTEESATVEESAEPEPVVEAPEATPAEETAAVNDLGEPEDNAELTTT